MIDESISHCLRIAHPAVYRIRVSGRLKPDWSERLHGMRVSAAEGDGRAAVTEFSGLLPDLAALMGVLQQLCDCNIPLLSVECVSNGTCKQKS